VPDPTQRRTTVTEIERDRYGRPLIKPLNGGEPEAFTRVSTLSKALDDLNNLMLWKARKTAEGLVRRPDLLTRAAGAIANGDPDEDWVTKRDLNSIVKEATESAGASRGASAGTGFHSLTEAIDRGVEPLFVPEADKARLDDYRRAMHGFKALEVELFCVNDQLRTAGTFDRLVLCPDSRVRVADLKTGKSEANYPFATCVQIAIYAHSLRYDPETGERSPLHAALDLTTGLLIHLPPTGGCTVIPLDIELGWEAAQCATKVREFRSLKAEDIIRRVETWEVTA
jgi:hypothetical protein